MNKNTFKLVAKTPRPTNIARDGAKRPQYSIRDKKAVAAHVNNNALPIPITAKFLGLTEGQLRSWCSDAKNNKYSLSECVAVSRR